MLEEIQRRIENFQHRRAEISWHSQIQRLITLGFHLQLGNNISETEYRRNMPELTTHPVEAGGNFIIPLLVDPRISLFRQLQLHGVIPDSGVTDGDVALISLTEEGRDDIPKQPYHIWVNPGSIQRGTADFIDHERGLTIIETLALLREKPRLFTGKIYDTGLGLLSFGSDRQVRVVNIEEIICAHSSLRRRADPTVLSVYRWGASNRLS